MEEKMEAVVRLLEAADNQSRAAGSSLSMTLELMKNEMSEVLQDVLSTGSDHMLKTSYSLAAERIVSVSY